MGLLSKARTRVGVAVIGGALLAAGGTATAAVVATSPVSEVSEVAPVEPAEPASVTDTPAPAPAPVEQPAPQPVEPPVAAPEPATVDTVTKTQQDPAPVNDPSIGSRGADGQYTPAPPRVNPGEPPLAEDWHHVPAPAEPLPGEPGYVPPTQGD